MIGLAPLRILAELHGVFRLQLFYEMYPDRMIKEFAYGLDERKECMRGAMALGLRAAVAIYLDHHQKRRYTTPDVDGDHLTTYTDS